MKKVSCYLVIFLLFPFLADAQTWVEIAHQISTPTPPASADSNNFGRSVAMDGNYTVVGSPGEDSARGAAYVLFYDGHNWIKQAKLIASDGQAGDRFGCSVSISGNDIVVGAYHHQLDTNIGQGAAYIFTKPAGGWVDTTEIAKITASDGTTNDYFGKSVDISGNTIVVGAPTNVYLSSGSGSAYLFTKPGSSWVDTSETAILTTTGPAARLGYSISILGDEVLVGTPHNGAFIYVKPAGGWVDTTQTTDLATIEDGSFGTSVFLAENFALIGSPWGTINNNSKGRAMVLAKPSGGWETFTGGGVWIKPSDNAPYDYFGSSVCAKGDTLLIGATGNDDNGYLAGAAYVFIKPASGWAYPFLTETAKLIPVDGNSEDLFGASVSISGNYIAVGAFEDDSVQANSGSAYLFDFCYATYDTIQVTTCDQYITPSGSTITSSGTYSVTINNSSGCDSIITINATINKSGYYATDSTVCDSLNWIDGNTYIESDSLIDYIIPNGVGCDSTISLDLTVHHSTSSNQFISHCDTSYTWIDGITYYSNNDSAIFLTSNSVGCDSVITLDLVFVQPSFGTDSITSCGSYTWIDGNTYSSNNDTTKFIVPNSVGCDSIITLQLTINEYSISQIDTSISEGDSITIGISIYNSSGTYVDTLLNSENCDSIVTTNLNVLTTGIGTSQVSLIAPYPNPVRDIMQIRGLQNSKVDLLKVYDYTGRLVETVKQPDINTGLDMSELHTGLYLIEIYQKHSRYVFRVEKE